MAVDIANIPPTNPGTADITMSSGKIIALDSTVSLTNVPLQISGDPNTGLGRSSDGADSLMLVIGGSELLRFTIPSASAAIQVFGNFVMVSKVLKLDTTNSMTSVALQINADPNTGLGQIGGADTISLVAGGVEVLRADGVNSRVGVNITPTAPFHVNSANSSALVATMTVETSGSQAVATFATSATRRGGIRCDSSGNLTWYAKGGAMNFGVGGDEGGGDGGAITPMSITSVGNVILGVQSALATGATTGFPYIRGGAGTPTGVPTAVTGHYPLYWDTTNKKLYIYDGAWLGGTAPGIFS